MASTGGKSLGNGLPEVAAYVQAAFGTADPVFAEIEERATAAGMPAIHVSGFDARLLEVIALAAHARMIIEIGTLAGLSGVALARALPPGGVLHTFELNPRHAEVALESFRKAGVADRVTVHVGPAIERLAEVESAGPFDLAFIDAEKTGYPAYLDWCARNLRVGGVVLADNTFADGDVGRSEGATPAGNRATRAAIIKFNARLADPDGPFRSMVIPTGEGLSMGVRVR
jgi:caffeoyl-CoA O-methyltransferase